MARYTPLLEVTVAHGFFADGRCPGLQFTPSAATAQWLREHDGLCRATESGLLMLADSARLPGDGAPPAAPFMLAWALRCDDARFAAVTAHLPAPGDDGMLLFSPAATEDTEASAREPRDGTALHAADEAGAWPAPLARDAAATGPRRPLAWVEVPTPRAGRAAPARYVIRFAARAPIWKYCVVGPGAAEGLEIGPANANAAFEAPTPESLPDGRAVMAFRSKAGIALSERAGPRFQLRAGPPGAKVLVKRLPVAGAGPFARDTVNGVHTLVAEIYVHR